MENLTLDIFSGELEAAAVWLEAVQGLTAARERMRQIASNNPGKYFILSVADRSVLERIDTFDPRYPVQKPLEAGS